MRRPIFNIEFPTLGMLVCGGVCGLSLWLGNEKGLVAAQTIAAIAGTAYQSHISAKRAASKDAEDRKREEELQEVYSEEPPPIENKPIRPPYYRD